MPDRPLLKAPRTQWDHLEGVQSEEMSDSQVALLSVPVQKWNPRSSVRPPNRVPQERGHNATLNACGHKGHDGEQRSGNEDRPLVGFKRPFRLAGQEDSEVDNIHCVQHDRKTHHIEHDSIEQSGVVEVTRHSARGLKCYQDGLG